MSGTSGSDQRQHEQCRRGLGAFPRYSDQQRADTVRCLAEYVEQTIAKNRDTVPPDGQDHN